MTDFLSLKMCNKGRANIFAVDRDVIRRVSYPDSCMSQIIFVSSLKFLSEFGYYPQQMYIQIC
jgi:hypothetical protein